MLIKLIIFRGVITFKLRIWAPFKHEMTLSLFHIVSNTSKCTFLPQSPKTCRQPNFQSFTSVERRRSIAGPGERTWMYGLVWTKFWVSIRQIK